MTRVSLKEAYDNKDVVAQIYAIRDTAESAEDTAEQAVTTANTASDHVDALVPQVEGAVANANNASASAQASAQTVAGYENRLGAVEGDVVQLNTDVDGIESDLNAVTLRVTTAEGQIVTIQGRVTALETADGQNVKINAINDYAVGLTGTQENINGVKGFLQEIRRIVSGNYVRGNLTKLERWKINEAVSEQVTYWPIAVSNADITDFPLLIAMSETTDGRDILGFECKGQNGLTFGLRIVCTAQEVGLYLVGGATIQNIARITR